MENASLEHVSHSNTPFRHTKKWKMRHWNTFHIKNTSSDIQKKIENASLEHVSHKKTHHSDTKMENASLEHVSHKKHIIPS